MLGDNKEFISGFILSFVALVLPFWQYLHSKLIEKRQKNLIDFHDKFMIRLSNNAGVAGIDEQVAVVFELRNFPMYSPVIVRVLTDAIPRWEKELGAKPHFKGLITEARETINFLNRNFLTRFIIKQGYRLGLF